MKKNIFVYILFTLIAIVMTYPLVFKINTHMPGFFSSDESYWPIWNAWWIKYCLRNNLSVQNISVVAYPFGIREHVFGNLFFSINFFLAAVTNPIFTYNFQALLNFFLAATFTYLLVCVLTKNRIAAFLSGVIFGFCPYIFVRSWQHLGETYLWMMPLVLWGLFKLKEGSSAIVKALFILSIFLTAISFGTIYYTSVIAATFFVYFILYMLRNKNRMPEEFIKNNIAYLRRILLLGVIAFLFLSTQIYPFIKNAISSRNTLSSAFNPYHRPFNDLFTQSAKPLSYFFPAIVHPIFGKFTEQFIGSPLYGVSYTEHTLYLGWVPLILAFIAFRRWRKHKKLPVTSHQSPVNEDFYIGFFVWLAVVAWAFSQPPYFTFPYFKIYMPSFFMYKILPMFRAYCRFGIVVMLAVSVLAGFGLKFILERFKSNKTKIAIACLFTGLVLFEFWNWPPFKIIDLTKYPKVYDWLKYQKGDFVVAEYPLDADSPNNYYKLYQIVHEKGLINGTIPGTYANKVAKTIWELSEPRTVGILSWMKVKYVLLHKNAYESNNDINLLDELGKLKAKKIEGLRFIRNFEDTDVYEVTAKPIEPVIK